MSAWISQPLFWVGVVVLVGALLGLKRRVAGALICMCGVFFGILVGWSAVPESLLKELEDIYEQPAGDLGRFAGVIVLGGAIDGSPLRTQGSGALSNLNERMTVSAALVKSHANFTLVFSGSEREIVLRNGAAMSRAELIFRQLGVPAARVRFERESRNTYENAVLTAKLLGTQKDRPWLLVTSARHMARAMGSFRKAQVNVTPYPVDYMSNDEIEWGRYSVADGAREWQMVLREIGGSVVYALTGRSAG